MKKINGFIAAPFTPMKPNGEINYDLIPEYADFIARNGIDGVFICGSSGEGALLTREERILVAEKWVSSNKTDLKIIAHTGGTSVADQIKLAKHAQKIGAWGVATMAPAFLPPKRNEEFVQYCKAVADAAPKLPIYFYHIPVLNHFNLSLVNFLEGADKEIPNFAGVKFTDFNIHEFEQCKYVANGKFEMLWGIDEMFLDALAFGNKAGVGGTYNHCFSLYKNMKSAFDKNDLPICRDLQKKSHDFCSILGKYRGNIVGGKRIMKFLGLDCGPNRIPLQNISEEEEKTLKEDLEKIGFFNYCNK